MGAPTSKASCLSEIDSLTRQYQQCMKNIECYNMNMINSSPSQKSFYKTQIQKERAIASSIKAKNANVKIQMKGLK